MPLSASFINEHSRLIKKLKKRYKNASDLLSKTFFYYAIEYLPEYIKTNFIRNPVLYEGKPTMYDLFKLIRFKYTTKSGIQAKFEDILKKSKKVLNNKNVVGAEREKVVKFIKKLKKKIHKISQEPRAKIENKISKTPKFKKKIKKRIELAKKVHKKIDKKIFKMKNTAGGQAEPAHKIAKKYEKVKKMINIAEKGVKQKEDKIVPREVREKPRLIQKINQEQQQLRDRIQKIRDYKNKYPPQLRKQNDDFYNSRERSLRNQLVNAEQRKKQILEQAKRFQQNMDARTKRKLAKYTKLKQLIGKYKKEVEDTHEKARKDKKYEEFFKTARDVSNHLLYGKRAVPLDAFQREQLERISAGLPTFGEMKRRKQLELTFKNKYKAKLAKKLKERTAEQDKLNALRLEQEKLKAQTASTLKSKEAEHEKEKAKIQLERNKAEMNRMREQLKKDTEQIKKIRQLELEKEFTKKKSEMEVKQSKEEAQLQLAKQKTALTLQHERERLSEKKKRRLEEIQRYKEKKAKIPKKIETQVKSKLDIINTKQQLKIDRLKLDEDIKLAREKLQVDRLKFKNESISERLKKYYEKKKRLKEKVKQGKLTKTKMASEQRKLTDKIRNLEFDKRVIKERADIEKQDLETKNKLLTTITKAKVDDIKEKEDIERKKVKLSADIDKLALKKKYQEDILKRDRADLEKMKKQFELQNVGEQREMKKNPKKIIPDLKKDIKQIDKRANKMQDQQQKRYNALLAKQKELMEKNKNLNKQLNLKGGESLSLAKKHRDLELKFKNSASAYEKQIQTLKDNLRTLKGAQQTKQKELGDLKEKMNRITSSGKLAQQEKEKLRKQINHLSKQLNEIKLERDSFKQNKEQFEKQLQLNKKQYDVAMVQKKKELQYAAQQLNNMKAQYNQKTSHMRNEMNQIKKERDQLQKQYTFLRAKGNYKDSEVVKRKIGELDQYGSVFEKLLRSLNQTGMNLNKVKQSMLNKSKMISQQKTKLLLGGNNPKAQQIVKRINDEQQQIQKYTNVIAKEQQTISSVNKALSQFHKKLGREAQYYMSTYKPPTAFLQDLEKKVELRKKVSPTELQTMWQGIQAYKQQRNKRIQSLHKGVAQKVNNLDKIMEETRLKYKQYQEQMKNGKINRNPAYERQVMRQFSNFAREGTRLLGKIAGVEGEIIRGEQLKNRFKSLRKQVIKDNDDHNRFKQQMKSEFEQLNQARLQKYKTLEQKLLPKIEGVAKSLGKPHLFEPIRRLKGKTSRILDIYQEYYQNPKAYKQKLKEEGLPLKDVIKGRQPFVGDFFHRTQSVLPKQSNFYQQLLSGYKQNPNLRAQRALTQEKQEKEEQEEEERLKRQSTRKSLPSGQQRLEIESGPERKPLPSGQELKLLEEAPDIEELSSDIEGEEGMRIV